MSEEWLKFVRDNIAPVNIGTDSRCQTCGVLVAEPYDEHRMWHRNITTLFNAIMVELGENISETKTLELQDEILLEGLVQAVVLESTRLHRAYNLFPLELEERFQPLNQPTYPIYTDASLSCLPHYTKPETLNIVFHTGYTPASYSVTDHPELIRRSLTEGLVFDEGTNPQYPRRSFSPEQMRKFWANVNFGIKE